MLQKVKEKLPELLVVLLCLGLLGFGVSKKEGFHMDELLCFELSNAQFNPWIVPTQPEGRLAKFVRSEIQGETFGETLGNLADTVKDVLANRGASKLLTYKADVYPEPVWITAEQFHDYVTVEGGDAFQYLSVYFNVKDDNHPPLHFMLLHTMSSLFQGKVSIFAGCAINLAAVAAILILLIEIGRILARLLGMPERGRLLGIAAALLCGLSAGALASVLLIRMYCVVSAFCTALLYLCLKKWEEHSFGGHNKGLIAVTVLGFLTQYFFLFYCILLAAVTALLLWREKRRRECFVFVRSMAGAAAIGLACFPFAISDVFSSGRGVEALENLSSGLAGYGQRLAAFLGVLADRTFPAILLALLAAGAAWMILVCRKNKPAVEALWLLLFPVIGYFFLAARMSPYLVDRYLMPIFPLVMLAGAVVLVWIWCRLEERGAGRSVFYGMCGIVLVFQAVNLFQYDGSYLYQGYSGQLAVAQEYAESPCLCVYDGVGYYENLLEFTCYEETLLLTQAELENREDVESVSSCEELVVLLKQEADRGEAAKILEEKYGLTLKKELYAGGVHGDTVLLFGAQ